MNKTKTGKVKVVVYAIAKNEEKFAERWARSMSEADEVVVMDTGSTDRTMDILARHGVKVTRRLVRPWRFDTARNMSMDLIPADADICIRTDLDEYFTGTGWADKLRRAAERNPHANLFDFFYASPESIADGRLDEEKFPAHRPGILKWRYRVHEEVALSVPPHAVFVDGITLRHTPDMGKPRRYFELLEADMAENPCPHNALYLAAELWNVKTDCGRRRSLELLNNVLSGRLRDDITHIRVDHAMINLSAFLRALPPRLEKVHYAERIRMQNVKMNAMLFIVIAIRRGLWHEACSLLGEVDEMRFLAKAKWLAGACGYPALTVLFDTEHGHASEERHITVLNEINRLETEIGIPLRMNH